MARKLHRVENLLALTDPEDPKQQAFHIVAPSIPGFVFSSSPKAPGFSLLRIGSVYHQLMIKLGYPKYIGQGGDFGSFILCSMALEHSKSCVGIHLNYVFALPPTPFKNPLTYLQFMFGYLTGSELRKDLDRQQRWLKEESAYTAIQGTKPQAISLSLMDSPVGLLAWIREKVNEWSDPEFVSWHARIYKETTASAFPAIFAEVTPAQVAVGVSGFPNEHSATTIWWARATVAENIVLWKEHSKGGHFAALECGNVLKQDIMDFDKNIPEGDRRLLQLQDPQI